MKVVILFLIIICLFITACTCIPPTYNYTSYNMSIPYAQNEFTICGIDNYINNISTYDIPNIPYWYGYTYDGEKQMFIYNIKHDVNDTFVIKKVCPDKPILYFTRIGDNNVVLTENPYG